MTNGTFLFDENISGSINETDSPPLPDVSEAEILFDILFMAIFGFLGILFGCLGVVVVQKNTILNGIVEHCAFVDLFQLTLINFCHFFWAVPCAVWGLNEVLPFLDHFFSGFVMCAPAISFPPKILLGINRFCALAFDGRFYKDFEKTKPLQYAIIVVYPLMSGIVWSIPGCRCIFIPYGQNFFYVEGDCGEVMIYWSQNIIGWIVLGFATFFDSSVFFMMRKRVRAFREVQTVTSRQKGEQLRKEFKLAVQMIINLCTGFILTISIAVAAEYVTTSPLAAFVLFTAEWQFCTLITWYSCSLTHKIYFYIFLRLSYVILLRETKPKDLGLIVSVSSNN